MFKCLQLCTVLATLLSLKLFQNRKLTQETHERFPLRVNSSVPLAPAFSPPCVGAHAARGSSCCTSLPSRLRATLLKVRFGTADLEVLRSQLSHLVTKCWSPWRLFLSQQMELLAAMLPTPPSSEVQEGEVWTIKHRPQTRHPWWAHTSGGRGAAYMQQLLCSELGRHSPSLSSQTCHPGRSKRSNSINKYTITNCAACRRNNQGLSKNTAGAHTDLVWQPGKVLLKKWCLIDS